MSLVGPRPIVVDEQMEYGSRLKEFLSVKLGALGLWQASGRANIGYPERCNIELTYVHNAGIMILKSSLSVVLVLSKRMGLFK